MQVNVLGNVYTAYVDDRGNYVIADQNTGEWVYRKVIAESRSSVHNPVLLGWHMRDKEGVIVLCNAMTRMAIEMVFSAVIKTERKVWQTRR